ncbi:MAG TPA: DUF222 domain-containing protein [Nocardioides sp.]|nr:DUF222 domain-containing protein [Nocardioides sp.]
MTAMAHHEHPVTRALVEVRQKLADVAQVPLWSMAAEQATSTLEEILAVEAQLAELKTRTLTQVEALEVPRQSGATSTGNWLAVRTNLTRATAFRTVRVAAGLERYDQVREAMAEGRVHAEQVEVIVRALDDLPDDLDPALVEEAEGHLVTEAGRFDAVGLKKLGRRLLEVVDQDAADAHEAKLLEKEERDAQAAMRLTMYDDGHGKVHGRFVLDSTTGAALRKMILAIAAPKHQAATQGPLGERKPTAERMGQAFGELINRYPVGKLPQAGGLNATLVVTMTLESLMGGLKAAQLDTGQTISASLARRMACEAGIIPAALGGKSEVLDLGRSRRFHSGSTPAPNASSNSSPPAAVRSTAATPHPDSTHLHHTIEWSLGGRTDLDNTIMICGPHHARAHDPTYQLTPIPGDKFTFHRRT